MRAFLAIGTGSRSGLVHNLNRFEEHYDKQVIHATK